MRPEQFEIGYQKYDGFGGSGQGLSAGTEGGLSLVRNAFCEMVDGPPVGRYEK